MSGTTEGPGWPADPTAAPPAEVETVDEPTEETEVEEKPKRGRPKKSDK